MITLQLILWLTLYGWLWNGEVQAERPASGVKTNLQVRVNQSDVIVVGEFRGTEKNRKAKAPIKVLDVLRGESSPNREVVACFRASALTITPRQRSKWIFFTKAFRSEERG